MRATLNCGHSALDCLGNKSRLPLRTQEAADTSEALQGLAQHGGQLGWHTLQPHLHMGNLGYGAEGRGRKTSLLDRPIRGDSVPAAKPASSLGTAVPLPASHPWWHM
jgi:hypothetical protein